MFYPTGSGTLGRNAASRGRRTSRCDCSLQYGGKQCGFCLPGRPAWYSKKGIVTHVAGNHGLVARNRVISPAGGETP